MIKISCNIGKEYTVLENSYWTNYTKIKCSLLCNEIS